MTPLVFLVLGFIFGIAKADDNTKFPANFSFGVATSSYQIEGAWNEDGKGENNWDRITHINPDFITNRDNGDVACDSYHKYEEDVALLVNLNVTHYRFSLSWSRLLPNGLINEPNQAGIDYYKKLIKLLKKNEIEPYVTLFHWDTPQYIEEMGGWPDPNVVDWFSNYTNFCFEQFGDDVKHWMTFNEAKQTCTRGYGEGDYAPAIKSPGIGEYWCIRNVILAHAATWRIYDEKYRSKQLGQVGIVIDSNWWEPFNNASAADNEASEKMLQFSFGMYANPIIKGDFPDIVKNTIERRSKAQGFTKSRLPEFTEAEKKFINGTYDFIGVNQYSSKLVKPIISPDPTGMGYEADSEVKSWFDPNWPTGACDWLVVTPWGVQKLLKWIKEEYNNPPLIITENGFSDSTGTTTDDDRINYIKNYLSYIKKAMDTDKVNVMGYTVWSLLDNLEWTFGYTNKFGLYHVDFSSPNKTRTPKNSVEFYKHLIKTRCLGVCTPTTPVPTNPTETTSTSKPATTS